MLNIESFIIENILIFWLVLGALCIFLEAAAIPGIGFLFAGFSALTVGGLINFGALESSDLTLQMALFLALTFIWMLILWIPLNKFRQNKTANNFSNIVGDLAVVESDVLGQDKTGKVKWSGTIMKAKLVESYAGDPLNKGDEVVIESVEGNLLKVNKARI